MCLLKNILRLFTVILKNLNIEEEDVWTRVFVQILDGHARKWFKELLAGSIARIKQLDETFLKHWVTEEILSTTSQNSET
jgi:hypothetical protein